MEKSKQQYNLTVLLILVIVVLSIIWLTEGFLLFHFLAENFTILIGLALFLVGTRTYRYSKNTVVSFIGTAYLFVALLGIMHTATYKGMNLIPGISANMATQFWVVRRLIESASLLIATFIKRKELSIWKLVVGFFTITLVLVVSIFTKVFPACFVDGVGVTTFKKVAEYLVVLLSLLTLLRLKHLRGHLESSFVRVFGWAIVFGMAAELTFTLYTSVYDGFNVAGHLFYVFSISLIGMFVVLEGLDKPLDIMFQGLYQRSIRDQLTGLLNRHGLEELSKASFDKTKRYPVPYCVVVMDLDNFKTINDEFGHTEGDLALIEFGRILHRNFREYDLIIRLGGDEFMALVEGGEAVALATEVRLYAAVESWRQKSDRRQNLGVSLGIALRPFGSDASLASLIAEADAKMMARKAIKHPDRVLRSEFSISENGTP